MTDLTSQPWFGWSLVLIFALPVLVILLSEVHLRLHRAGNPLAGPVNRLRVVLLPLAGLLILLTQASGLSSDNDGVRIVATVVGVMAVATALSGLNAVLFGNAVEGTWRDRLPSIFVDLARLILVVTGAAIVASFVWGLDVGGLFAALGVGSIVIGLALQNAVGSVVSGLLLLFEQPFKIGDTLDVGGVTGKVVEMNWRSTHIDVGSGIQIIPNATIAGASFTNLSRPTVAHDLVVETSFASDDAPHQVVATLTDVANSLTILRPDATPTVRMNGRGAYAVTLPLRTASDSGRAKHLFMTWLWYASRRDEISLDGATFVQRPREDVTAALSSVASTLELEPEDIEAMADQCEIETYGSGELLEWEGRTPRRMSFIVTGTARVSATALDGARLTVTNLDKGEVIGVTSLTREPALATSEASSVIEVLQVPLDIIDRLVGTKPRVARRLANHVETRRTQITAAFEAVNSDDALTAPVVPARCTESRAPHALRHRRTVMENPVTVTATPDQRPDVDPLGTAGLTLSAGEVALPCRTRPPQ
jgi:small-conductance mechanosensitive channel/CRP-like cAMP-binding protein